MTLTEKRLSINLTMNSIQHAVRVHCCSEGDAGAYREQQGTAVWTKLILQGAIQCSLSGRLSGSFQAASEEPKMASAKRIISMTEAWCVSQYTDLWWSAGALGLGFGSRDKLRYQHRWGGGLSFIYLPQSKAPRPLQRQNKWTQKIQRCTRHQGWRW